MSAMVATVDDKVRETYYDSPPYGYQQSGSGEIDTVSGFSEGVEDIEERLREAFTTPRPDFSGGGMTLRAMKPVSLRIHKDEDLWFVENDRLDIRATGETIQEAVDEFEVLLIYFYRHYRDLDESKALKYAKELKNLFMTGFVESKS